MLNFFRKNDKKDTEEEEAGTGYDWTIPKLARELQIHPNTFRNWLRKTRVIKYIKRTKWAYVIPQDIADAILGLASDPPRYISPLEYTHTYSWLGRQSGLSYDMIKKRIRELGLKSCLEWDKRGTRIPRSVCKMIWPYLFIHPQERRQVQHNERKQREARVKRQFEQLEN